MRHITLTLDAFFRFLDDEEIKAAATCDLQGQYDRDEIHDLHTTDARYVTLPRVRDLVDMMYRLPHELEHRYGIDTGNIQPRIFHGYYWYPNDPNRGELALEPYDSRDDATAWVMERDRLTELHGYDTSEGHLVIYLAAAPSGYPGSWFQWPDRISIEITTRLQYMLLVWWDRQTARMSR